MSVHRLYTLNGQNMTIMGVYMCLSMDRQFKLNLVHANVAIINGAHNMRESQFVVSLPAASTFCCEWLG